MALKPLNPATCPKCGSKNTSRGGFVKEANKSLWKCREADCGEEFYLAVLVLVPSET